MDYRSDTWKILRTTTPTPLESITEGSSSKHANEDTLETQTTIDDVQNI